MNLHEVVVFISFNAVLELCQMKCHNKLTVVVWIQRYEPAFCNKQWQAATSVYFERKKIKESMIDFIDVPVFRPNKKEFANFSSLIEFENPI